MSKAQRAKRVTDDFRCRSLELLLLVTAIAKCMKPDEVVAVRTRLGLFYFMLKKLPFITIFYVPTITFA